ncbi:unnamed protein product [Caenorhabditis brenneri]
MPVVIHEQCFDFNASVEDIRKCLKHDHRMLVLLRGVTGSGKSDLARMLLNIANSNGSKTSYLSSDEIDASQLTKKLRKSLKDDVVLIVVDTEIIERTDVRKFSELGIAEGYELYVVEPETSWKYDALECKKRSSRNEDVESIDKKISAIKSYRPHWEQLIDTTSRRFNIQNYHQDDYSPLTPPSSDTPAGSPTGSPSLTESPNTSITSLPKMFSLAPTPKTKVMKTIATNVTFECLAVELADYESTENCGYFFENEETVPFVINTNRITERKTETHELSLGRKGETVQGPPPPLLYGQGKELEFSILALIFPTVEHYDMRHQLQLLSYQETFDLMLILGEKTSNPRFLNDHGEEWHTLEFNESYTYLYNNDMDDRIEELAKQRDALDFDEEMFVTDETENDIAIAQLLHEQLNHVEEPSLGAHAEQNIDCLQKMFYHTDKTVIRRAYLFSNQNLGLARTFLLDEGEKEVSASAKIKTFSQTVAKSPSRVIKKKTIEEEKNHFLKQRKGRQHASLATVQAEAMRIRRNLDSERVANTSYNPVTGSQFHQTVVGDRNLRLKENMSAAVKEIDKKIRDAHSNPWNLDLHFMSVDGARGLVSEAIEAIRYYVNNLKIYKRMVVVTGSGNNSKKGAKIKPGIEAMLRDRKIPYELVNDGCIEIKVK